MSDRPPDRLLAEAFRLILARELPAGTNLRTQHEDTPEDGAPRALPMIGIAATRTAEDYALTDAHRHPAALMELRFECRADADTPGSAQALETLAEQVKTAVAAATASDFTGWDVVDNFEWSGTERGFDQSARIISLLATCFTLRTV
jgi:hypothetical protein